MKVVSALQFKARAAIEANDPWQDPWELEHLIDFVRKEASVVETVLEIGTNRGGSARVWRDVFRPRLVVTVDVAPDLLEGDMDGITTILGWDSQSAEAQRQVEVALAGSPVDFLFVDGGHSYPEVWGDYEAYGKFVRPGGVIAFHDIGAGASHEPQGCHVPIFWDEIVRKGGKTAAWRKSLGTGAKVVQ